MSCQQQYLGDLFEMFTINYFSWLLVENHIPFYAKKYFSNLDTV